MANWVITCTIKSDNPRSSALDSRGCHITDVGLDNGITFTVKEVYASIESGSTFHTMSPAAQVNQFHCTTCGVATLKSHADGVWNNNLDNLPSCG